MKHVVRIELLESRESGRKNGRPVQEVLDCFEVDCDDMADGQELMEQLGSFIEAQGGDIDEDE